jgi:hypothetical protein
MIIGSKKKGAVRKKGRWDSLKKGYSGEASSDVHRVADLVAT